MNNLDELTKERNFKNSIVSHLSNSQKIPDLEEIEKVTLAFSKIPPVYEGDINKVVSEVMMAINAKMGLGVLLIDHAAKHDDKWLDKREEVDWVYSSAYSEFLRNEGWPPQLVQSLSDVTAKILSNLQDPASEGTSWNRRGLVIGHVQSGKTANYTGLIARAADVGYKFIIVIAGIHNNLRKQTQQRIDEAFIGRSSDPENRKRIGVGLSESYPYPATLTNIHEDFNKNTADKSGFKIDDYRKPTILVIKKNVNTLTALHNWLKELNAGTGDGRISDVPMLLIDDEADNASINTNKPEIDPTRTNSMIRKILGLFAKSSYVGYTATPFANIFINPEAYDKDAREELFPRDFIYCLDAPTTYFGAEKVFLDEDTSKKILRTIDDAEDYIPLTHKKNFIIRELPPSLYRALDLFILSRSITILRGNSNKHCSMIVNVSRFVDVQKTVRDFLSLREKEIRASINNVGSDSLFKDVHLNRLYKVFQEEYSHLGYDWEQIFSTFSAVFANFKLFVINSKSDEVLDFSSYENDGVGLTALAIGGLSLSRGLTIDGLTISYMYRNSKMYDTLMQMGRWFGYRFGYEDLCRVSLTNESISWYSHISSASIELTQQIKKMRRDGLSPKNFGLYVLSHPDAPLLITAMNKMRSGEKLTFSRNYTGKRVETYSVSNNKEINKRNFNLIKNNWVEEWGGVGFLEVNKGFLFKDVDTDLISDFIYKFEVCEDFSATKNDVLSFLSKIKDKHPVADVLLISPKGSNTESYTLTDQPRKVIQLDDYGWRMHKDRVSSGGDEGLGLTPDQKLEAESLATSGEMPSKVSDTHYREIRNKPLLMIHSIKPNHKGEDKESVAAYTITFPDGLYDATIEVVANRIWLEKMNGIPDSPDEEDDYDD